MCLIVLAWRVSPAVRLAVAANRDEFFAREAAPAAWWADAPDVFAGRDLRSGGTWLGVTRSGRFAALTNFRDMSVAKKDAATSRGALVREFLRMEESAADYASRLRAGSGAFEGFNLLLFDGRDLVSYSNVEGAPVVLPPGVYGLSNHLLETPWPKVVAARERLAEAALAGAAPQNLEASLLALLSDRAVAPDGALPDTGLPLAWERALSAAFVVLPDYGTRASTAVVVTGERVRFVERSFGEGGTLLGEVRETFEVSAAPRA
ncbi:MAG TPA: NRDE family protein [Thermoanaerobaculia bacterium]|nr:NRDE family protein [Thermoanaerobaculia bacterium]